MSSYPQVAAPQVAAYQQYLAAINRDFPNYSLRDLTLARVNEILTATNWEAPATSLDWNNLAVISLIAAAQSTDLSLRRMHINAAMECLNQGATLDEHPLCAVHFVLIYSTIGEMDIAIPASMSIFANLLPLAFSNSKSVPPGIVYFPSRGHDVVKKFPRQIEWVIEAENGYMQALLLLSESLWVHQISLFKGIAKKRLVIVQQLLPKLAEINLKLGIQSFIENSTDGFLYIYKSLDLSPDHPTILHALYIAYRTFGYLGHAVDCLHYSRHIADSQEPMSRKWRWLNLAPDSPFTYLEFEQSLLIAVQPSFQSIVTSVLIAEGDWFEMEMEFWRNSIQPGMTVLDVGANAGVYALSAASRVGNDGIVVAIEPLVQCVAYLQESCRVNQINCVRVWLGAASDRNGMLRLKLSSASELNEIITEEEAASLEVERFVEVPCFTLDSIVEQEQLSKVDFLKIDAEGHEVQVLRGSTRLLTEFQPVILYENLAGDRGNNQDVAVLLQQQGYQLYTYQPFLEQLVPIGDSDRWKSSLNVIALPPKFAGS